MKLILMNHTKGKPERQVGRDPFLGWYGLAAIVAALVCEPLLAWAPATHLFFAKEALHFAHLLPSGLRALLLAFRTDFLYGCIAADITLGKAYVEYMYNCHNFSVGWGLLHHAKTDAARAFVYGYIAHLATDTVSHNFFVPYQNIEHFETARFRHAYWEVRLDQYFADRVWSEIEVIMKHPKTHEYDQLLDHALKDTIFSFKTNKVLFSSMMAVQRLKKWRQFVKAVNLRSSRRFNPHHLSEYNRLAVTAILLALSQGEESPVYRVDPTGALELKEAASIRKMLKDLRRKKELTTAVWEAECHRYRERVRELYFSGYSIQDPHFKPSIDLFA